MSPALPLLGQLVYHMYNLFVYLSAGQLSKCETSGRRWRWGAFPARLVHLPPGLLAPPHLGANTVLEVFLYLSVFASTGWKCCDS